jgi:peptide/nickel transport system substrate-binding protein
VRNGLLTGMALLALTAGLASASPAKQGGIFVLGTTGASTEVDPQVAYVTTTWWLEYATAAKLYNYPDKRGQAGALLRPEVASGLTVSRDARTYTFTIRKGFRFSDGAPVTATNFAYAFRRAMDPDLASPASALIPEVRSAHAKGNKLVIRLESPDASLLTKLAMPFFQATSLKLPLKTEVTTGYPSAGPYYFAKNVVNELTSLRRNPYWHGNRPRHLDGVDVRWNLEEQSAYRQTLAGGLDEGPIPASERAALSDRLGINKTRFWRKPSRCMTFIVLNNEKGVFAGNAALRKAFNWAIDRTEYLAANFGITPWTHLLSPVAPGSITAKRKQPYGVHSNIAKARALAAGHLGDGPVKVWYRSSGTVNPQQAQLVKRDLIRLGVDPARIVLKGVSGADIYTATGVRGADFDVSPLLGWCSDYPDDSSFLASALASAHFHDASIDRKLAAASKLPARQRASVLGRLDLEIMRQLAPIAPIGYFNNFFFFSRRVDPRSLVYSSAYADWSIPALRLK